MGLHVYHVAYVYMAKRMLDFLRVKNDGYYWSYYWHWDPIGIPGPPPVYYLHNI